MKRVDLNTPAFRSRSLNFQDLRALSNVVIRYREEKGNKVTSVVPSMDKDGWLMAGWQSYCYSYSDGWWLLGLS